MVDKLETTDRGILEFKPNIFFTEPDQEPGVIEGKDSLQFEDVQDSRVKIKKLAQAVNTLATAVQARADLEADGIVIDLDANVDQDAVQAMIRRFPDADPKRISYKQYRECKNGIRAKGEAIGRQALVTPEDIQKARSNFEKGKPIGKYVPGGFLNSEGSMRPELDSNNQIIQPLNVEKMQIDLICILVNFIWKNFIKPMMAGLGPVSIAVKALPDTLCNPGFTGNIPGLFLLGNQPDALQTGKKAADAISELAKKKIGKKTADATSELAKKKTGIK